MRPSSGRGGSLSPARPRKSSATPRTGRPKNILAVVLVEPIEIFSGGSLDYSAGVFTFIKYPLNQKKRNFFSEKFVTVPSRWGFGVKNRSLGGFPPGPGVPKTIFDCGAKAAA